MAHEWRSLLGAAVLGLVLQIGSDAGARADGALAVGSTGNVVKHGIAFGMVVNVPADKASETALTRCKTFKAREAADRCKVVATFSRECFAVAYDPQPGTPGAGWGVGKDQLAANTKALTMCEETAGPARRGYCQVETGGCDTTGSLEPSPAPPNPKKASEIRSSGTGFLVANGSRILTNAHVVRDCGRIQIRRVGTAPTLARVVAVDQANDLALLGADLDFAVSTTPSIRRGARVGEAVFAYGFPLAGLLSTSGNFTSGNITANTGIKDDITKLQFSAPVQPGSSGGPLLDQSGNIVGIVVAKLNVLGVVDLPQNVNFAIKASVVIDFLETHGVKAETTAATKALVPADIAERASAASVYIACN